MTAKNRRRVAALAAVFIALLILLAGGLVAVRHIRTYYQRLSHPMRYSDIIESYADERAMDRYLVYAVVKTESGFNPDAVSNVGARGLMQLMQDAFDWTKFRMGDGGETAYDDMFNPEYNIEYGTYMLMLLMDEYDGNVETALAAYHAGRGQVNRWLADPAYSGDGKSLRTIPIKDTAHYVDKVTRAWAVYRALYAEDA